MLIGIFASIVVATVFVDILSSEPTYEKSHNEAGNKEECMCECFCDSRDLCYNEEQVCVDIKDFAKMKAKIEVYEEYTGIELD